MSAENANPDVTHAEKMFNNKNVLLLTFHEQEFNSSVVKKLHLGIKNVHILQPIYIPKWRCLVEIQENCNVELIRKMLMKKSFGNGYITADFVKNVQDMGRNIDPCTLYVRNLPKNTSARDVAVLFPLCKQYQFLPSNIDNTKCALIRFPTVKDAVTAYKSISDSFVEQEVIDCDEDLVSEANEDDVEHENSEDDIFFSDEVFFDEDNEEYESEDETHETSNVSSEVREADTENDEGETSNSGSDQDNDKVSANEDVSKLIPINKAEHSRQNENGVDKNKRQLDIETVLNALREEELDDEDIIDKNFDPYTLYVYNLPSVTSVEDLVKLYPMCKEYQFLTPPQGHASIEIRFANVQESLEAYKATNNLIYKSNKLLVRFNYNHVKNGESVKKRKLPYNETNSLKKNAPDCDSSSDDDTDDVIIVGFSKINSNEEMKEDDIEYKSEDEVYVNDMEVVLDEDDEDEYVIEDEDLQSLELDETDTFLPDDDNDEDD